MLRALVRVDRVRRRVWLAGQRVHHGALGVVMVLSGLALAVHDRSDARQWFRRDRAF